MSRPTRKRDAKAALLDVQQIVRDFNSGVPLASLRERQYRWLNRLLRERADAAQAVAERYHGSRAFIAAASLRAAVLGRKRRA